MMPASRASPTVSQAAESASTRPSGASSALIATGTSCQRPRYTTPAESGVHGSHEEGAPTALTAAGHRTRLQPPPPPATPHLL